MVNSGKSAWSLAISSTIERRIWASSAESGSSPQNTRGPAANAPPHATRAPAPPPRQLAREALGVLRHADDPQRLVDALRNELFRRAARVEAESDVFGNAHVG